MKYSFALLPLCIASACSYADDSDIEKITVSGDFRQSTLDQLSTSATIVNSDRLSRRQGEHLDSILNVAPNVNFASGASRGRFIQIRGIGERSQFVEPYNPSVAFLVDDFDFSGLAAAGLLFDTQQVEVFRGPQATIFGTGALAGAIKIESNPTGDVAPDFVDVRLATQDSFRFEAGYGGELSNRVKYRASFVHNRSDGFIKNSYLQRDDTDNIDETALRLAADIEVSDTMQMAVNYRWYDIDNGYDAFSLDNNGITLSDDPGFDRQKTHAVSVNLSQELSLGVVNFIVTHAAHDIGYGYDEDWTYEGFHPWGYTSTDYYFRDVSTQTGELRFTSSDKAKLFDDSTDYVVGVRYKQSEEDLRREYTYADGTFTSVYEPQTIAFYAQTNSQLSDALSLTFGLRVENYDFDYADNDDLVAGTDTTMVGGKIAANYQLGQHFLYASVSRGFKGAGVNPDQLLSDADRFYDAEYNWNYEVGIKGPLFSDDVTLRAALFYMDRENTQVSDSQVISRDDGTSDFISYVSNADVGTNQGAELELNWQVLSPWTLQASVGYLDAMLERFTQADGTVVAKQRQAQSPKFTGNFYSQLMLGQQWQWNLDIDVKDEYRFSDSHDVTSPFTVLVNSEIIWSQDQWQASLWVKNALDRTYYVRGFGGFSNDPRDYYAFDEPYYQLGDGRQFGLSARYEF
jgi:outer membrane receptor protein involved in Fe transport